ncbi:NAD(P)-binding protein [Byssothecium circinans]|uniref:NAD(P)-binding protein n=1 Tax=Byssothecium circinans TaxID=147558 RepID=A0A6A5TWG0_9PLEO|nr:NAD(P)-binding protein [Byssothecium circinans]
MCTIDPAKHASLTTGKVVLATGALGGLNQEIAKTWSAADVKGIVLVARDAKKLESAAAELQLKRRPLVIAADVVKEEDVKSVFDQAIAKFGTIDAVINTAGTMNVNGSIGEISPSHCWNDYETNVKDTYNLAHYFIPATGGKGTYINLVSLGASFVAPGSPSYGSAKLASIRLGELLDHEKPDLRTFSVFPGILDATGTRGMVVDHFTPFAKDKHALAAAFMLYLLEPEANFLRSEYVSVNWDVEEMDKHKQEIQDGKLLKLGFIGAKLGPRRSSLGTVGAPTRLRACFEVNLI